MSPSDPPPPEPRDNPGRPMGVESGANVTHPEAGAGCCAPSGEASDGARPPLPDPGHTTRREQAVILPDGDFWMGSEDVDVVPQDHEGPIRLVRTHGYGIDACAVTVADFGAFVEQTGWLTDAERFGWSFVFARFLPKALRKASPRVPEAPWWCAVQGASWREPEGPGSDHADRLDHPVTHMSWHDATAFASWSGGRLPAETEWERAARGGLERRRFPWGDDLLPDGEHRCNIWQGAFPTRNEGHDGWVGTAPVRTFAPNGLGLYEMSGNVWEWCDDRWLHRPAAVGQPTDCADETARVMRGGSYLCHASYCNRYRVAARSKNQPDSSTGNHGFRCAYDLA